MAFSQASVHAISIHALREEGDLKTAKLRRRMTVFQSTPSARRATRRSWPLLWRRSNFNPRPPRGGRLEAAGLVGLLVQFQSTPSARRATVPAGLRREGRGISIHALREEGDKGHADPAAQCRISIHALREEGDLWASTSFCASFRFQSTPSARRATIRDSAAAHHNLDFNPRPPRGGRPSCGRPSCHAVRYFNPRPPRGGRLQVEPRTARVGDISIHALREEGDGIRPAVVVAGDISIHALREEGD